MIVAINQVEYSTKNEPVIHIFGRTQDRQPVCIDVTGFRPYFYAPISQADFIKPPRFFFVDKSHIFYSIKGDYLRRIYTTNPRNIAEHRDLYQHFEADIPFTTRFLIDMGITSGIDTPSPLVDFTNVRPVKISDIPPRVCILDIECYSDVTFPEAEKDAIICITCWDSYEDDYVTFFLREGGINVENEYSPRENHIVKCYDDEVLLINAFVRYIKERDPDILTGWNFIEFDMPYIIKRMTVLGLMADELARLRGDPVRTQKLRGRALFDLLTGYKKMQRIQKDSYRLDAIAQEELKESKMHISGSMAKVWKNNPKELIEYNFKDVELCVKINNKNGIVNFFTEIARYVGCPLDKTLASSSVIDIFLLRKAHGKYVLPSKGQSSGEKFAGATVFEPAFGLKENIAVLDLKSLYPMSMMTINASPETKDPKGEFVAPNGIRFKKEPDGLTRIILEDLLKEREMKKKEMKKYPYKSNEYNVLDMQQEVIKILMNTYYGVSGYERFRLHDREIAAAITSVGREIIAHTKREVEKAGYSVVYGDTDSTMVQMPAGTIEETVERAKKLEEQINASYSEFAKRLNATEHRFSTKFEKLYKRFFQAGKKKRYGGLLVWKDGQRVHDVTFAGFEVRRSDSSQLTKEVETKIITMILEGNTEEEIKKNVKNYLADVIRKFRKMEYSLDMIGIPGGIQKSLESYANGEIRARAARYSNEHLGTQFGRGSKPKRVYIKQVKGKYQQTDVISFEYGEDVPKEFVVDVDRMMEVTLKKPLERILGVINLTWMDVDPSIPKLFDYF